ncbi:MAG: hypothetical protein CVT79_13390 [Alphaproteobacteria bacterium HGW-Alphaproteobacteria-18]|nr:MAG: hypothetical protein CVT79_13390 [Alphaproteobacteria bacterium HGW-Alphaproteobacteria-18]
MFFWHSAYFAILGSDWTGTKMSNLPLQAVAGRLSAFAAGSPRTVAVLAVYGVIACVALVHLVLALAGQNSGAWILRDLLIGEVPEAADSWSVMIVALEWLDVHPNADGNLYRDVFFDELNKFQYAPTSLLPLDVLRLMGFEITPLLLNHINRIILLVTALGVGALCWVLPERLVKGPLDADTRRARLLLALVAPGAAMLFFPLIYGYHIGQLQIWINALFVGACITWVCGHRATTGVLIGLICMLKPQFGLFLIWGLFRREWRFTVALLATGTLGLALSVAIYGFGNHLGYLEVLTYLSRHGESYWANQSANGLLQRIFENGDIHDFGVDEFPPFHPVIYAGSMLVTVAFLSIVFLLRRGEGKTISFYDFIFAALVFTAASPIAWEHHYGILAPIFAVLASVWMLSAPRNGPFWFSAGLGVAFLIAAVPLGGLRFAPGLLHVLMSHLYFAALFVLAILWAMARGGRWGLPGGRPLSSGEGA